MNNLIVLIENKASSKHALIQVAARLLADLEGDEKREYFGHCFIIFINLQYRSQNFFSLSF